MAKICAVSDETKEMVRDLAAETGLERFLNIEALAVAKQKQLIKITMASPIVAYKGKCPSDTCFILIYEEAFERLEKKQQELVLKDAFNNIVYDSEKDKVKIGCPSITVSIYGRQKLGNDLLDAIEAGEYAIQQIEEEKKAEKEAEKESKKKKNN